jgi:alpha-D-xyloside xylohydrolase
MPTVTPFGANSFRIQYSPPGLPIVNSSYSPFLAAPLSSSPFTSSATSFTHGNLRLDVDPATGFFTATRISDGFLVQRVTSLVFGPAVARGRYPSSQLEVQGHAQGESLVGMGEQGLSGRVTLEQPFERSYQDTEFYPSNQGRQAFMPLYFSSAGYGVMMAQPGYGWLRVDASPSVSVFNASSQATLDMWITTTPSTPVYAQGTPHPLLALLSQYADAVGYAPPMPFFTTGFIASKDRYHNQSQFLDVAHGYISRNIPLSLLTIDWFHWPQLGDMELNPLCWPDPQGMVDELSGLGIETMITHWPFMSNASKHRASYEAAGALAINISSGKADTFWSYLQEGALITTLTPATQELTMQSWLAGYGRLGIRAIWLDETEPDRTGPANDLAAAGGWSYEGMPVTEVGPSWRQQWLVTMTGVLRELHGEGNYFLMSRSAWLGTAKLGHAVWSGDTESSWESLALQVPTGLGAGLSGIGHWTSDLGGYSPTMQPFDPKLEELLVRWAQFASLSPLMRLHGHRAGGPPPDPVCMQTNGDNEPWTLFANSSNYAAFVAAVAWREQQRNYIADLQQQLTLTATPLIAPVWLHFPGEAACAFSSSGEDNAGCSGAFMLGQDWLAKPVTAYAQASAWVWLPALPLGQSWVYHFEPYTNYGQGGVNVTLATPVDKFPLFYRQRA